MKKSSLIIIFGLLTVFIFQESQSSYESGQQGTVIDNCKTINQARALMMAEFQERGDIYPFDSNSRDPINPDDPIKLSPQQKTLQDGFNNLDKEELKRALGQGANINIHYATFSEEVGFGAYKYYLKNSGQFIGTTPLMALCLEKQKSFSKQYKDFFNYLLTIDTLELRRKNIFMQTALHYAAIAINEFAVIALAEKDPFLITMQDYDGNTVFDLLNRRKDNKEAANLMVKLNHILERNRTIQ
jgi:hypothetical protein